MINQVIEHWNREPCHDWAGKNLEQGSLEYFEAIERDRYEKQRSIHSFVQFPRWHGKSVLEVGCGMGTDGLQFIRSGTFYEGIDASTKSIELAEKRFYNYGFRSSIRTPNFRCLVMDAEHMTYENNLFDLVYSWGVIHHAPTPEKVVSEIYRVLRPGGLFRGMIYHRFSTMGLAVWMRDVKRYRSPLVSLRTAFARSFESPGTKGYSFSEAKKLFSRFSGVKITPDFTPEYSKLKGTSMEFLLKIYPSCLASWILIEGRK